MIFKLVILMIFGLSANVNSADLESIKSCQLNEKILNECLKNVMIDKFHKLHNPNKNAIFDTIDPYFFENGALIFNQSQVARGEFSIYNTTVIGSKNLELKRLTTEKDKRNKKMSILGHLLAPNAKVEGFFKSNISINEFTFVSQGSFDGTFSQANGKFNISGIFEDIKDGKKKFKVTDFDIIFVVTNMKFNLTGITKDDNINKIITQIINDGWKPVYQDVVAHTKPIWSPIAVQLFNELFSYVIFSNE